MKENFPDMEPNVILRDDISPNPYVTEVHCSPWSFGKATLIGDSCHTQGPEGAVGLNLNYEIAMGIRDYLAQYPNDFATAF